MRSMMIKRFLKYSIFAKRKKMVDMQFLHESSFEGMDKRRETLTE